MTALERARGWFIAPPEATGDDEPVWCALSPPPTVSPESASETPVSPERGPWGTVSSEPAAEKPVSPARAAPEMVSSEGAPQAGGAPLTRVFRRLAGAPLLSSPPTSAGARGRPVTSPTAADRRRRPRRTRPPRRRARLRTSPRPARRRRPSTTRPPDRRTLGRGAPGGRPSPMLSPRAWKGAPHRPAPHSSGRRTQTSRSWRRLARSRPPPCSDARGRSNRWRRPWRSRCGGRPVPRPRPWGSWVRGCPRSRRAAGRRGGSASGSSITGSRFVSGGGSHGCGWTRRTDGSRPPRGASRSSALRPCWRSRLLATPTRTARCSTATCCWSSRPTRKGRWRASPRRVSRTCRS